jgi:hypothetical protein
MKNKMKNNKLLIPILLSALLATTSVQAGPYKVGNGDVGADLSAFEEVHVGKLKKTQKMAADLLKKLNVKQLPRLELLTPEVAKSDLYLIKPELTQERLKELGQWEEKSGHNVYARTFARPHAATRFYRQALDLSDQKLIALHIHEGLHRALPKSIREDEKIVTKITGLLTTPDITFDSIKRELSKIHPMFDVNSEASDVAASQKFHPSYLKFGISEYTSPREIQENRRLPISRRYRFGTMLYPFEDYNQLSVIGFGFDTSVIELNDDASNFFGPFSLTVKGKIWRIGKFDVSGFVKGTFNTFSEEKIEQSLEGRDYITLGVDFQKKKRKYYFHHGIEFLTESEVKTSNRKYLIGNIGKFWLKTGKQIDRHFKVGGRAELIYLDSFGVRGDGLNINKGGSQFLSLGPDINYMNKDYSIQFLGKYLLDTQEDDEYNFINDLFDNGQGQWQWTLSYQLKF